MSLPVASRVCAECGAAIDAGQSRCWLCKSERVGHAPVNPYASPLPTQDNLAWQFSLSSLFLITTLIAVCLGVTLLMPGLGVLLWIFAVPALVRTVIDIRKHKRRGAALGALFLGFIANALILVGLSQFWLQAIYGLVILIAVSADAIILRRLHRAATLNRSR